MGLYDKPESFRPSHWYWIIGLGLVYALYVATSWSAGYIDFGDGNYMYIAWRLSEGAVVYRDILAPQPPAHLFLGAGLVKLGGALQWIGEHAGLGFLAGSLTTLYVFRIFSLLLHLATYALVLRLAWRAWGRPATTVLAGAIWLWMPINTWWSMGYQSEPLEIFFLLLMMTAALKGDAIGDLWAGLFAAMAGLTNATAAPFLLVLIVFMLIRAPLRALRMAAPCILLAGAVVFVLERWTGGSFLQCAVFNQVGTFPSDSIGHFVNYAAGKLTDQGGKVLAKEGVFFVLALMGLWRYLHASPLDGVSCSGLGWFFLSTLCSLVYVTKGGTEDYIFNLSEPAVAILAAGELMALGRRWMTPLPELRPGWSVKGVAFWPLKTAATLILAVAALGAGVIFHIQVRSEMAYELDGASAERLAFHIRKASGPGDRILAPPYYAVLAQRRIWGDYSELFIWQMKYWKERKEAEMSRRARPLDSDEGWRKARAMADAISRKELPVVVLEMDQTGAFPEVMKALQAAYVPQPSPLSKPGEPAGFIVPTLNTRLGIFEPLGGEAGADQIAEQKDRWRLFKLEMLYYWPLEAIQRKFRKWYDLDLTAATAPPAPTKLSITPVIKHHAPLTTQTQAKKPAPAPAPEPIKTATEQTTATAPLRVKTPPHKATLTTGTLTTQTQVKPVERAPALPTPIAPEIAPMKPTSGTLGATPTPQARRRKSSSKTVDVRPSDLE